MDKIDKTMKSLDSIKTNLTKRKSFNNFRISKLESYTILSIIKRAIRKNYDLFGVLNPEVVYTDKDKLLYISKNLKEISEVLESVAHRLPLSEGDQITKPDWIRMNTNKIMCRDKEVLYEWEYK